MVSGKQGAVNMLEGVKGALQLVQKGWDYLFMENEISGFIFALLFLMLFITFIFGKLVNRGD